MISDCTNGPLRWRQGAVPPPEPRPPEEHAADGAELSADPLVLDRSRALPDGMHGVIYLDGREMTPEALTVATELAQRARVEFPRAGVVVSPGAPADSHGSGVGAGGYLVLVEGPFLPVPETDGEGVVWHRTIRESLEARAQARNLPSVGFIRLDFSRLAPWR